jgi:hypothetical protein
VKSTKVLRSIGQGTNRVHQRLNPWRAMIVCWRANRPSNSTLTAIAEPTGPGVPVSIDLGTPKFPTKPIMTRKVPKKRR